MGIQVVQRLRGHPATILLFVALQCIGTTITTGPTASLIFKITSAACHEGAPPQSADDRSCVAEEQGTFILNLWTYSTIMTILGLVMTGPLSMLTDMVGPGKRGLAMVLSAMLMAAGDIWLYMCCECYSVLDAHHG